MQRDRDPGRAAGDLPGVSAADATMREAEGGAGLRGDSLTVAEVSGPQAAHCTPGGPDTSARDTAASLVVRPLLDLLIHPLRPVHGAANRDLVYWYGDMDFVTHFWGLLGLRGVEALVTIQPRIECFRYEDNSAGRKKLAEDCYNRVLGKVFEGDSAPEDEEDAAASESTTLFPS